MVDEAIDRLSSQVKSSVMFEQSIQALSVKGESHFIEVGFGGVLTNLVKRIDRKADRIKIGTYAEWEKEVSQLVSSVEESNKE